MPDVAGPPSKSSSFTLEQRRIEIGVDGKLSCRLLVLKT
jgi:hypothetical protein